MNLKGWEWASLIQMTIISTTTGKISFKKKGLALIVNIRVQKTAFGCNIKHDRMISVRFQGIVIQVIITFGCIKWLAFFLTWLAFL